MKTPYEVYAVFDLETTGLKSRKHWYKKKGSKDIVSGNAGVIEIAICPFTNELKDLPEYTSGIISLSEDRDINQGALDANGVTRKQIENGRSPKEVAKELKEYFKKLAKTGSKIILCGHNIDDFDIPFLDDFLEEQGVDMSKLANEKFTIDTMHWARARKNEQPNYRLGTCCEIEKIDLVDAHRALTDTRANKQLVKKYIKSLRDDGVESVEKETERPRVKFKM